ncbi:P-loop containing nucleoside triphosphate hydrolase protein [Nemania sp. FL0031]|nr:P-loop containing nucleoside triphosphate hydrolase protein [Nemania sp. FL0031]
MSRGSQSGGRGHIYGPPGGSDYDTHIERIIGHTNSLFPESQHQLPQIFTPSTSQWNEGGSSGGQGQADNLALYEDLDDFNRSIPSYPEPIYHPPGTRIFPNSGASQRLSLPLNPNINRQSRVLGDASHHFRPFLRRDPDYHSPFQSSPHSYSDQVPELQYASSTHDVGPLLSSPQALPHPLSVPTASFPFEPLHHFPFSNQNSAQRFGQLQSRTELFTPPFDNAKTTPPANSSLTGSSPSGNGPSSPSTRIIQERQRNVAKRNHLAPKWNQNLQLNLDHASDLPPIINNTRLVDPRQSLPDKFRAIFPFQLFNAVQSRCFPLVYGTNDNVVISAPTGSGKTAILEMAICKLVSSQGADNFKIVYQAPTKSLCSEKARNWQAKFSHMNLQCVELTGDTSQAEAYRVGSASIIVTTPEKWDSITRKWKDHRKLLELVRLVLIDEVHILKDVRGATLEAVVSRMKTIGANIRFVAISATVPNIDDVAKWLGRDNRNQIEPARFEVFGEELRPVKLQRYVYGYDGSPNDFIFEKALDGKLNLLLAKHSQGKPIMVFCITRKSCEHTARSLAEWWSTCRADDQLWPSPKSRVPVLSSDLQELVRCGVAFHHAGLDIKDRAAIETSFLSGQLHVICCTSTLAVGVNLPCHTVVLKGTRHYTDDGPQEYSDLEVMQMLGRAGRPQFDSNATAVIMTRLANTQRYKKLVSGEELLESTLHRNLLEHLNSEIGLGTIQDIPTAKKWIGGTFLSVRVRQAPSLYNLENIHTGGADEQMEEWCERDVKLLQDHDLVTKHLPLMCTEYGQAMSRYMIQFETMKLLLSIPPAAGMEEMLTVICKAIEFKDFRFKPTERAIFRELNKSPLILHPIRETLTLTWHKIFVIVQIYLGGVDLPTDKDSSFIRQDLLREKRVIFDRLKRLIRCVIDCKAFEGDGVGIKAALELSRSVAAQAWENKPTQLSQIPGFGPVAVRKWISHGVHTVLGVADKGVLDIERIASRNPPYGRGVQKMLEDFPRLTLKADLIESRAPSFKSNDPVSVTVKVHLGHRNTKVTPRWKDRIPALTFIALTSDGNLAYFWRGNMKKFDKSNGLDIKFPVALMAPSQTIFFHFSCEEIVGTEVVKTLEPNIPASVFINIKPRATQAAGPKSNLEDIEEDYEDISDEAMLRALGSPRSSRSDPDLKSLVPSDNIEEDFPLIDELLSQEDALLEVDLPKMGNGRYVCNHPCHNGGLTKLGKPCNHKCCREGVDKYRPPKPLKSTGLSNKGENGKSSQSHPGISRSPENIRQENGSSNPSHPSIRSKRDAIPVGQKGIGGRGQDISKAKRPHSLSDVHKPKRAKLTYLASPSGFMSDVEYVDLCDAGDDRDTSPIVEARSRSTVKSHRKKLLHLREEAKGHSATSSSTPRHRKGSSPANDNSRTYVSKGDEIIVRTTNADTICTPAEDDPFSDQYDEMSDLPDLNEFFGVKASLGDSKPSETASPRLGWTADETLYPGVASDRFDLPSNNNTVETSQVISPAKATQETRHLTPSSPLPGINVAAPASPQFKGSLADPCLSSGDGHFDSGNSLDLVWEPEGGGEDLSPHEPLESTEPAWLAEFDPDFIDSLRGVVNFID